MLDGLGGVFGKGIESSGAGGWVKVYTIGWGWRVIVTGVEVFNCLDVCCL